MLNYYFYLNMWIHVGNIPDRVEQIHFEFIISDDDESIYLVGGRQLSKRRAKNTFHEYSNWSSDMFCKVNVN